MQIAERELPARFSVRVGGLGAFPRPTKATVLWLGVVDNSEGLSQLAAAAEGAAVAAGFATEERPYHAHLTLARMRPQVDVGELIAGFDECGFELEVAAITLFESHIDRGGARYEALDRIPLP